MTTFYYLVLDDDEGLIPYRGSFQGLLKEVNGHECIAVWEADPRPWGQPPLLRDVTDAVSKSWMELNRSRLEYVDGHLWPVPLFVDRASSTLLTKLFGKSEAAR